VGHEGLFDFVFKVDFFVHGGSRTGLGEAANPVVLNYTGCDRVS
jgi:hypothetical protein